MEFANDFFSSAAEQPIDMTTSWLSLPMPANDPLWYLVQICVIIITHNGYAFSEEQNVLHYYQM